MQPAADANIDLDPTNTIQDAARWIDALTQDAARPPAAKARSFASTVAGAVRRGFAKVAGLGARAARAVGTTVRAAFVGSRALAVLAILLALTLGVGALVMR